MYKEVDTSWLQIMEPPPPVQTYTTKLPIMEPPVQADTTKLQIMEPPVQTDTTKFQIMEPPVQADTTKLQIIEPSPPCFNNAARRPTNQQSDHRVVTRHITKS